MDTKRRAGSQIGIGRPRSSAYPIRERQDVLEADLAGRSVTSGRVSCDVTPSSIVMTMLNTEREMRTSATNKKASPHNNDNDDEANERNDSRGERGAVGDARRGIHLLSRR